MPTSSDEHEKLVDHRQPGVLKQGDVADEDHQSGRSPDASRDAVHLPTARSAAVDSMKRNEPDHNIDREAGHESEHEEQEDEDEDTTYPEPEAAAAGASSLLPPPDFRPFFTLIEDANGDHHHPSIHYIFADDDPYILTDAALETLSTTLQPHPQFEKEIPDQRFVVVDMAADGKDVVSASSLSPDWQALTTRTSPAPSWGGEGAKGFADRALMLTISGQEVRDQTTGTKGKRKTGSVEGLLKAFDANLCSLDSILGKEVTKVDTHVAQHE